ncbi:MAG: hypothetical protein E7I45_08765 [Eikenella corrodens]|uniref:hypothetical protein n=1 Tax=Eikenella corrodens TaxID=539 RepID=UPI002907CAED|nr:hypothetical protein [Eikenella corrodens]MDU4301048.1 hypothetical protein [Eikenella corrodens]
MDMFEQPGQTASNNIVDTGLVGRAEKLGINWVVCVCSGSLQIGANAETAAFGNILVAGVGFIEFLLSLGGCFFSAGELLNTISPACLRVGMGGAVGARPMMWCGLSGKGRSSQQRGQ